MWPFKKREITAEPPASSGVTPNMLEAYFLTLHGSGIRIARLYTNMLGCQGEIIDNRNMSEFLEYAHRPPAFTPEGVIYTLDHVTEGIDGLANSSAFDLATYGVYNDQNQENRYFIDPVRAAILKVGFKALSDQVGFDLGSLIQRVAVQRRERDFRVIAEKLEEKRAFLKPLLLRARARGQNEYGDHDPSLYIEELYKFMKMYFPPENLHFFYHLYPTKFILGHVDGWFEEPVDTLAVPVDGIDFEHWCSERLKEQGWMTRVSKASGDQGIDIEAMKDGRLVAIQCKRYAGAVGNKAVQEVHTGMTHYRADAAVVIGTGGFTKAATDLAQTTGVILLDAENISEFTRAVSNS